MGFPGQQRGSNGRPKWLSSRPRFASYSWWGQLVKFPSVFIHLSLFWPLVTRHQRWRHRHGNSGPPTASPGRGELIASAFIYYFSHLTCGRALHYWYLVLSFASGKKKTQNKTTQHWYIYLWNWPFNLEGRGKKNTSSDWKEEGKNIFRPSMFKLKAI